MKRFLAILDVLLFALLCAMLGLGPLAFGAVHNGSICSLEVAVALLVALWAVREMASPRSEVVLSPLIVPALCFAAIVDAQLLPGRSAYWNATWTRGLLWASYAGLLFVTPQILKRRVWLDSFGVFLPVYGFLVAFFAIVQQLTWNGRIYWFIANQHSGWVYGPYVNHAHYAGLMELLTPLPMFFAMSNFLGKPLKALALFGAVVMASTIFFSQSIGGILSFMAELLLILAIALLPDRRAGRNMLLLGAMCVLLLVSLFALHPSGLADRLAQLRNPMNTDISAARIAIFFDSFKMARQRPLLGWGLGTFPVVYPSFRSFYSDFWINEAHNDYAQALVETGILGFSAAMMFVFLLIRSSLRHIRAWRQDPAAAIRLGAFVGCIGLLVHGLFDFNLQIPANAALFFSLAAVAAAPHATEHRPKLRTRYRTSVSRRTSPEWSISSPAKVRPEVR